MQKQLPWGIVQACAGIVADCATQPYREAIRAAEQAVGQTYGESAAAQQNRQQLVEMVKLNLINRKRNDRESLNRRYGMQVSERTLRQEKRQFCYALAKALGML